MRYEAERAAVVETAQAMFADGLVIGSSGNVSSQIEGEDLVAITPHGTPYPTMKPEDVIVVDFDGEVVEGEKIPSVESTIHIGLIRERPDIASVIHTHALYASMFAVSHTPLPAVIDEFAVDIGTDLPVAEYGISGSDDLARNVAEAFGTHGRAALMANHGLVVGHTGLDKALQLSREIERTAHILFGARLLGGAQPLPDEAANLYKTVFEYKVSQERGDG